MKEIVIEIPDHVYEHMIETGFVDLEANQMGYAILHGKVLPEGHGRLIEVTPRLEAYLSTFQSYTGIDEAPYEYADELIRNADTVVEADKGE